MPKLRLFTAIAIAFTSASAQAERREFDFSVVADIDAQGRVVQADLNNDKVGDVFANGIEKLVREWRFHPATRAGKAVATHTTLRAHVVADIDDSGAKMTASYRGHGPRTLLQAPPQYPATALRSGTNAEVEARVRVSANGDVESAEVYAARTTHANAAMGKRFIEETLKTLREWKFEPEQVGGQPVASELIVPIRYTTDGQPSKRWTWTLEPQVPVLPAPDFKSDQPVAVGNPTGLELLSDRQPG
ncbi:MAG: energy transducer TonB [Xanthomonadales bacterium]|nr:energy transducer TonB [Xanthomonadales bacterium]